ncbi:MAG: polysaccharide biosynthesis tyrosine autokinase [Sphingomicrobium sp.]
MNVSRNELIQAPRGTLMPITDGPALTQEFVYHPESGANLIDLRKIWSSLWRNRLLVLAIVGACLALGVLSIFLTDPTYRATARIEIDDQPVKVLGTEEYKPSSPQEADRFLQTNVDVIKSRGLAERVADGLNLAANDRFLESVGVKSKPGIRREQVISALQKNLSVELPRNTRVIPLSFDSKDPKLAANIANSYAENLIGANLQRHFDTSAYSKEFLKNQLSVTKSRLEGSERALLGYARSVGLVDPSAGAGNPDDPANAGPHSLTSANLIDLNRSLAAAQASRMQAEGRWREAQGTSAMSLPEVLSNPAIQQMTQRRAELEAAYQQELQHRKPDHPAVQQAAAAIRELNQQIGTMSAGIRNSIRNQYMAARQNETQLAASVGRLKGATLAEQSLGIRYNILKREVDTNRQLYDGLLQRYKEVSAQAGVTNNNISVVDPAFPPMIPVSPNPLVNMALAALAGLVLAAVAVAGLETFRDGVRAPDEVEERFGVPVLGVVPRLSAREIAAEALTDPESELSEAYQTVRASVELSAAGRPPKSLVITSSRESEGKSTTALAMARHAAQSGRSVLLIDADLRRPSLHGLLGTGKAPGLSNLLTQPMQPQSAIQQTDTPGLSFIPAGPKPPSPAELLSGPAFEKLLAELETLFDQVIIDSPPVLGLADSARLAAAVDGTIMVIEANRPQRGAIEAALHRLTSARANIIGAVLVKFDPKKADVGSSYLINYYSYGKGWSDSDDDRVSEAA